MSLPKNMTFRFFIVFVFTVLFVTVYGQSGKDGVKVISSPNTTVNDYTNLTLDVAAGTSLIQVGSNQLITGFISPLSTGDLVFIIQVQGAVMNANDDSSYGEILAYQHCGNYEFAEVSGISGLDGILLSCPLRYNYSASGKSMVIRVPRYSALTINGGGTLTCPSWNGSTGGVIALEVFGSTIINGGGSIDATGKGFRGGITMNVSSGYGVLNYKSLSNTGGAEKGESVAGSVIDYDTFGGRYCKGAPANGGGGGNAHNGGGGGGANAGSLATYTGNGTPDVSNPSWAAAWNLESPGFSTAVSSGGGKGGYTFSSSNQNALTIGPFNAAWSGDLRRDNGGKGGRPLDYSTGRIFFGGGGGAGEENDNRGGSGGNGGGIIAMLCYSDIGGSGQIVANGGNGSSTTGTNGTDAAGGGGGGGSILLNASGMITGVTISANGGNGGNQIVSAFSLETEGPGGGGGGGFIAVTNGSPTKSAIGGSNGTTNSVSLTEFPPNGATKGGDGISNGAIGTFSILASPVNLCSSLSATLTFSTQGIVPPGIVYHWYDQPFGGVSLGTGTTFTTPVLTTSKTYYIGYCPSTLRVPVQVNISTSPTISFTSTSVCAGEPTVFTSTGSPGITNWSWDFGNSTGTSSQQNTSYVYSSGGSYTVTLTASDGICSSSVSQSVTVVQAPVASFSVAGATGCLPLQVSFTNNSSGANSYAWNFGDGSATSSQTNPAHTYTNSGQFAVTLVATTGSCTDTFSITNGVQAVNSPTASFVSPAVVCLGDSVHFSNTSVGNGSASITYNWNFGDGTTVNLISPAHRYTATGTYAVTLLINSGNCIDDTVISVQVDPTPTVNFSSTNVQSCDTGTVYFNNLSAGASTFKWYFGDGDSSSLQSPSHFYTNPGTYSVTLQVVSAGGCTRSATRLNLIKIDQTPVAVISSSAQNICPNQCIAFNAQGAGITSWQWSFNGASTLNASIHNPGNICYTTPGNYNVTLTVSNGSCTNTVSEQSFIQVVNCSVKPSAAFIMSDTSVCVGSCISFVDLSQNAIAWEWFFPGASPSTSIVEHPSNICYANSGVYPVTLISSNTSGSDTVVFNNLIQVAANPSQPLISVSGNVLSATSAAFYQWYFNGIPVSGANGQQFTASLTGDYSVEVTDANGCNAYSSSLHFPVVGIDEISSEMLFLVYPNPSKCEVNVIVSNNNSTNLTFVLHDETGRKIFTKRYSDLSMDENINFNLSGIANGLYFLQISSDKGIWMRPIIKN